MPSGGSSDVTIGYKYYLGVHLALAHGPLDNVNRIEVDRRIAWEGINEGTSISIDKPELFGGDEREGGVSGTVDIEMGLPSQGANSYLSSVLGTDMPAFRGVACAVLNQVYTGNNPYLKPWSFRAQRIFLTSEGADQWYSSLAGVASPDCNVDPYACDAFREELAASIDNVWGLEQLDSNNFALPITGAYDMALDLGPASIFSDDPVIEDACYRSWKRIAVGGGGGTYGARVPFANSGTSWEGDMGVIARHYGAGGYNGVGREILRRNVVLRRTSDNFPLKSINIALSVSSQYGTSYNPGLVLAVTDPNGGNDHYADYDFSGVNGPDNYHWYNLGFSVELSGTAGAWVLEITAGMRLDKVVRGTVELVSSPLGYPYPVHLDGAYAYWGDGDGVNAFFTNAYYNNTTLLTGVVEALGGAYEQNLPGYVSQECYDCADMNPAHIIYECLTDSHWGMGYASSDIDETAFMAAADTLFTENMGISVLWQREQPIEEFIQIILSHIDGVLYVDRTTGKFVLNLIRDDYADDTSLIILDETNIASISDAKRPTTGELTSSVTVNFWDRETGETGSTTEHNWPLIQLQGAQTHTTVQYPGFTNYQIAQQVAIRDLKALSTPLLSCRIEAGREAAELNVGDPFLLDWPDLSIDVLVMRVQQLTLGDNRDNTVVIDALEDAFGTPVAWTNSTPERDIWVDPASGNPRDSVPRIVTEAPYYELVRLEGQSVIDTEIANNNGLGFLLVAGGRQGNEINARLQVDSGSGYVNASVLDFAPYAFLLGEINETETEILIQGAVDLDLVVVPAIAQIGEEIIRVDSIVQDSNGNYDVLVVGRGILDTVPASHGLESATVDSVNTNRQDAIVFWDVDVASDEVEYSASESVNVKIQTREGDSQQALDAVPFDTIQFNYRAFRPYPPGQLRIDGEAYPEANTSTEIYYDSLHLISWAHRDRLQQTDGNLYDYTENSIGPEDGTTYRIDIYSTLQDGTVTDPWWTVNGITGSSYQMDSASPDTSRGDPPHDTELVHIKVTSVRDGLDSWQSPVATLSYLTADSVADSVGDSVGVIDSVGVLPDSIGSADFALLTEDGVPLQTEDGGTIDTEG